MDRFTNSAHMDKLEIIIVRGVMLSIPILSASSLASLKICASFLGCQWLATKIHYLQTLDMQVQHNDRGSHS